MGKLRVGEPCPLLDCGRPVVARGKCVGHYGQWRRGEELRPLRTWTSNSGVCTFPDCGRDRRGRGLCGGHLAQWYEGRPLAPLRVPIEGCSFEGCPKDHEAHGLCRGHLWQQRQGKPLTPLRSYARKGWYLDSNGYQLVLDPEHPNARANGYVLEHVKVMAAILERPLLPFEEVHHRNGVKVDNHPDNLELWNTSQPAGQRTEDKVACAIRTLELYAPKVLAQG